MVVFVYLAVYILRTIEINEALNISVLSRLDLLNDCSGQVLKTTLEVQLKLHYWNQMSLVVM